MPFSSTLPSPKAVIISDGDGDGAANGSEADIVLRLASERR